MILTGDGVLIISEDGKGIGSFGYEGMILREIGEENRADIRKAIIENGVSRISAYEFADCMNLTEIEIPDSVMEIGIGAFSGCSSLREIQIPFGVEEIGADAFSECTALNNVEILSPTITSAAFEGCMALQKVSIPNSTSIEYMAFYGCSNLKSIVIPSTVKWIQYHAFGDCKKLSEIYFMGDAPELEERVLSPGWGMKRKPYSGEIFFGVDATVYYPKGNATWTEDIKDEFGKGGKINWIPYVA